MLKSLGREIVISHCSQERVGDHVYSHSRIRHAPGEQGVDGARGLGQQAEYLVPRALRPLNGHLVRPSWLNALVVWLNVNHVSEHVTGVGLQALRVISEIELIRQWGRNPPASTT
jgi:hypothetical protein